MYKGPGFPHLCLPQLELGHFVSDEQGKQWVSDKIGHPEKPSKLHPNNWLLDEHYYVYCKGETSERVSQVQDKWERSLPSMGN